ncbi:hypothetical protein E2C01_080415 [Portunus trituberculatus]|uniref:Uncharacterized protein n=1 Tax=Portunus trituberculatus TaxID=210409 RepID=A0A5B7ITE6_PORTR|nr:hypothetical protein [Portunus trituberculatus]
MRSSRRTTREQIAPR